MWMIDTDRKQSVRSTQLYLTVSEARELRLKLDHLLADPEANEHCHVLSTDFSREISCSVVTPQKLAHGSYTRLERSVLDEG